MAQKRIDVTAAMHDFVFDLSKLVLKLYKQRGYRVVTGVIVNHEYGLSLGLLPGDHGVVSTACGDVQVISERRENARRVKTFCEKYFCNLERNHPGEHDCPGGCITGCSVEGCPNK